MKTVIFLVLLMCFNYLAISQSKINSAIYPTLGKPMPNFILYDVDNFSKRQVSLKDFHGKWLVLDWWTKYCSYCIESFPRINTLQQKFEGKIQFVFIGYTGSSDFDGRKEPANMAVRNIYSKAMAKLKLKIPIAYDSILYQKFNLGSTPYIVVIDPNGIVRAITYQLSADDIENILRGRNVTLKKAYRKDEAMPTYNSNLPFLTYGNGGPDTAFVFRSLLSNWFFNMAVDLPGVIYQANHPNRFEALGANLERLYNYAYIGKDGWAWNDSLYGQVYPIPILETRDSLLFRHDMNTGKGIYCYSLTLPSSKSTQNDLMKVMQNDLKNYFDFNVSVETRFMPYWKLVATDEAKRKLKTIGGPKLRHQNSDGLTLKNVPINELIAALWSYNQRSFPFLDETTITDNIDLTVNALLTDFCDFKRTLNENGLDLILSKKPMKVIIIGDRN